MFDLQVNGFKNEEVSCNFWQQPSTGEIKLLNSFLYKEGVFHYLATLITDSYDSIKANLEILQTAQNDQLVGAHIEGGLISKLGVHPKNFAQEFNLKKSKNS